MEVRCFVLDMNWLYIKDEICTSKGEINGSLYDILPFIFIHCIVISINSSGSQSFDPT
jgi:hypothetical protein